MGASSHPVQINEVAKASTNMAEGWQKYSKQNLLATARDRGVVAGGAEYNEARGSGSDKYSAQNLTKLTTGQNLDGMANGFNTEFLSTFVRNYNDSMSQGGDTLNWFRDKKDGIALWDDEEAGIKFGDVFQGGVKKENLYDTYGKEGADAIMRPMVMSATEQANGFSIDERRKENTDNAKVAREAGGGNDGRYYQQVKEFQSNVDREKDSWDQAETDTKTVAGGVIGGLVAGAGAGAVFGGWGALPGAVIGAVTGGVGAFMNRDEIQDQAARVKVQSEMAAREGGDPARLSTTLKGWAGLAGNAMNPLSNVVHGAADTEVIGWGKQGDGQSAYYEIDPTTGEQKRSGLWTAADLGATFVGGAGLFGSAAGRVAFTAQMGSQIGGSVGELAFTGGKTFDDSMGQYDSIFLDEEGNFNLGSSAAGIGSIGVDALQLGLGRGIMKGAAKMGAGQGTKAERALGALTGTKTKYGDVEVLDGMRFVVKDGVAVSSRMAASALAPSEMMQYASTRLRAALSKRGTGTQLTADDLYRTAVSAQQNAKLVPSMIVNAFGEGVEEGTQEALNSISHGHDVDWEAVTDAFQAGAAMGAGMTLGSRAGLLTQSQRDRAQHNAIARVTGQPELSAREWREAEKSGATRALREAQKPMSEVMRQTATQLAEEHEISTLKSDVFAQRKYAAVEAMVESARKNTNDATDNTSIMSQSSPEFDDHLASFSLNTLALNFQSKQTGLKQQIEAAPKEQKPQLEAVLQRVTQWSDLLRQASTAFYDPATPDDRRKELVDMLNQAITTAWDLDPADQDSIVNAMSVATLLHRNPSDNPNSIQIFQPFISLEDSRPSTTDPTRGIGDNQIKVSNAPMMGMGGDFDGDKLTVLARLIMNEDQFRNMRNGTFLRSSQIDPIILSTPSWEEHAITVLGDALDNGTIASKATATTTLARLEQALLREFVDITGVNKAVDQLISQLRDGNPKAKTNFLTQIVKTGETDLLNWANEKWVNPWFRMNSLIRQSLWDFQRAEAAANSAERSKQLNDTYNPVDAKTQYGRRVAAQAATITQSLWMNSPGEDIFRNWQSLNYAAVRSNEDKVTEADRTIFREMSEMYARLNSNMGESKVDQILVKDRTTRNVIRKLRAFAREQLNQGAPGLASEVAIANQEVPQFVRDQDGEPRLNGRSPKQTVLQWFLREELMQENRAAGAAWTEADTARFNRLYSLSPGEAFVEVFGGHTMRELLGLNGDVFGGNLSLSQIHAQMVNQDNHHRKLSESVLKQHAAYTRKAGEHDMPYRMDDEGGQVTTYQSVVDSLFEASRKKISYDPKKEAREQVGGALGRQSRATSEALRSAFQELWTSMGRIKGFDRTDRTRVLRFLEANPSLADAYLGVLPDDAAATAISDDGRPSEYLLDALTARTEKEAEAILWRGLLISRWNAMGKSNRTYHSIGDRFHLLMYRLALPGMEQAQERFYTELANMTDVDQFVAWVNDEQNLLRQNEAAYTAWNTDLATIDPTYSEGKLSQSLVSPDIRTAISEFHKKTEQFAKYQDEDMAAMELDRKVLAQLRSALSGNGTAEETALLNTLNRRLGFSKDFRPTLGPKAMHEAVYGNLLMLKNATDKGKSAEHVSSVGAADIIEAMREFSTAEQARLASMTANSLTNLLQNPSKLIDPMRVMDDRGNTIEWDGLTAEVIVEMYDNDAFRPILRSMFFPSLLETTVPGKVSQQFLSDMSLASLLGANPIEKEMHTENPGSGAMMRYLAMVDGSTNRHDAMRYAGVLAAAMTSRSKVSILTQDQAGYLSEEAMVKTARAIRDLAPFAKVPTAETFEIEDPNDPSKTITYHPATVLDAMREKLRIQMRAKSAPSAHTLSKQDRQFIELAMMELATAPEGGLSNDEISARHEIMETLDSKLNNRLAPKILRSYGFQDAGKSDWYESSKEVRARITEYVMNNGGLISQMPSFDVITKMRSENPTLRDGLPDLTSTEWAEASRAVVAHALQSTIMTTIPGHSILAPNEASLEGIKYFDPSYEFLLDDLVSSASPMIQAANKLTASFSEKRAELFEGDVLRRVFEDLLNPRNYGPLTDSVVVNMLQFNNRVNSAAAGVGIQAAGLVSKDMAAAHFATMRTYVEPDQGLLRTTIVTLDDLRKQTTIVDSTAAYNPPRLLNGRFIRNLRIVGDGEAYAPLYERAFENVTVPFQSAEVLDSEYRALHLSKLEELLEGISRDEGIAAADLVVEFEFFHPDDQPLGLANNLFFEGTAPGDNAYGSLMSAWWTSPGGVVQRGQTTALEGSKKSKPAITKPKELTRDQSDGLRGGWATDISGTMRAMADAMLEHNALGDGVTVDPVYYNVIVKTLQLRHVVRITTDDGGFEVLSFEQARDRQRNGEQFDPAKAELIALSESAVATLHGSLDQWGSGMVPLTALSTNMFNTQAWTGVFDQEHKDRLPGLFKKGKHSLFEGVHRGPSTFQKLGSPTFIDPQRRDKLADGISFEADQANLAAQVQQMRVQKLTPQQMSNSQQRAADVVKTTVQSHTAAQAMAALGVKVFPDSTAVSDLAMQVVMDKANTWSDRAKGRAVHTYRDQAPTDSNVDSSFGSIYGYSALEHRGEPKTTWVTRQDTVVVDLDSFNEKDELALPQLQRVLHRLMGFGADIILSSGRGRNELTTLAREIIRENGYESIPGASLVFSRAEIGETPINVVATYDRLVEMGEESSYNLVSLFQSNIAGLSENAGLVLDPKHGRTKVLASSQLPLNYAGFGLVPPSELEDVKRRVAAAREELRQLSVVDTTTDASGKRTNVMLEAGSQEARELDQAIDRMLDLQDTGLYGYGETIRLGDIIPLYNQRTGQIILYRYGYEPMSAERRAELDSEHANILIYNARLDSNATAYTGEILEFTPAGPQGLSLALRVPVQTLGAKMVVEGSGFKITMTQAPDSWNFTMPEVFDNLPMEAIISPDDTKSKNNYLGRVNNFRDAFAYLGVDFRPDLAEALFDDRSRVDDVAGVLNAFASKLGTYTVKQVNSLMEQGGIDVSLANALETMSGIGIDTKALLDQLKQSTSPQLRILHATLTYLLWKDARVTDILTSPGLSNGSPRTLDSKIWKMPSLFTQYFEATAPSDPLRKHLFEMLNERFPNRKVASDGRRLGYHLNTDFTVQHINENPEFDGAGWLQFSELVIAPTSVEADATSAARTATQGAGVQAQQIVGAATGLRPAIQRDLVKEKRVVQTAPPSTPESMWQLLRKVNLAPNVTSWNNYTPRELEYLQQGRELAIAWRQPLDLEGWETSDKNKYIAERARVAADFGFTADEAVIVDTWVRQHQGRPTLTKRQIKKMSREELEQATSLTTPNFDQAMNALGMIDLNRKANLLPTADAAQPRMHINDLSKLHAAATNSGRWAPKRRLDDSGSLTTNWGDWLHIATSTGDTENEFFDPMFLTASDAFLHSYMDSDILFTGAPISSSQARAAALNDPHALLSDSPHRQRLLAQPEVEQMAWFMDPTVREATDTKIRRTQSWRKRNTDGGSPMGHTQMDMVKHGVRLVDYGNQGSAILRSATHIRAFNALLNPLLVVSAPLEAQVKNSLQDMSNVLRGESASGPFSPYSKEQRQEFRRLYEVLGQNPEFKSMVYNAFKLDPVPKSAGKIERGLAKVAAFAGKIQDPYYGMSANQMARRYVESVLMNIRAMEGLTNATPETITLELMNDATWVERNMKPLHQMALNTISDVKCVKTTTASLLWKRTLDPLTTSPRMAVAIPGTLLRLQFMFANYGLNTATRILGLQGVDAFVAATLHGRKKGPLMTRLSKAVNAVAGHDTSTTGEEVYDMSEVLEAIDMSDAFMKSSISLTSLFAFGLMVGSLGLTGEDEEDRRRRRIARFKGAAYLYDPRDIANDFRNVDSIFVDNIPIIGDIISPLFQVTVDSEELGLEGRSMARMNFISKQFLSPLLGMERFFQNGNPMEVLWGFEDAITSLPLVNTMGWEDAANTYAELMSQAEEQAAMGDPRNLPKTYNMMLSAVYNLERMMLENSFINQLYVGMDRYDRDPWKIVEKNAEGGTVTDRLGNALPTGAMESYVDPATGEVKEGYKRQEWLTAQHYAQTEKKLGLALLSEVFSFGKADALRSDMAVKTRKFDIQNMSTEEGMAIIRSIANGADPAKLNLGSAYLTADQRKEIKNLMEAELKAQGLEMGLSEFDANGRAWAILYGSDTNPDVPALNDVIWGEKQFKGLIPFKQTQQYLQLNTTYVKGPDGNYWATGVSRHLLDTLGGFAPFSRYLGEGDSGLPTDNRLNSVDDISGINTGFRGLERLEESYQVPDPIDALGDRLEDMFDELGEKLDGDGKKGSGWRNFGKRSGWRNFGKRSGWRNFGKRGGGGSGGQSTRLQAPQDNQVPYTNSAQNVNANNPIIRRATIRRERSDSDKGRLKPWQ